MGRIFFTSDTHFDHARILVLGAGRPFRDIDHMNETLVANAWEVMGEDDTLYHLGDAAMGDFDKSLGLLRRMPGKKKFLIPGNHDKVFPRLNTRARIDRFTPRYEEAGYEVLDIHHEINLQGERVLLSHVPYSPERLDGRADKLAFARPEDQGLWLVHGHTHSDSKSSEHPREIHVGVDANDWRPVSEDEILSRIRSADF